VKLKMKGSKSLPPVTQLLDADFDMVAAQISAAADAGQPKARKPRVTKPKAVEADAGQPKARKPRVAKPKAAAPVVVAKPAPVEWVSASEALDPDVEAAIEEAKKDNRRSIVPQTYKVRYAKHQGTCGDDMALELKAETTGALGKLDLPRLREIAEQNGLDVTKYAKLNPGQWRMNVGNRLRGKLDRGEDVVVGTRRFSAEDWAPRAGH
jgi:hypothetical protein